MAVFQFILSTFLFIYIYFFLNLRLTNESFKHKKRT